MTKLGLLPALMMVGCNALFDLEPTDPSSPNARIAFDSFVTLSDAWSTTGTPWLEIGDAVAPVPTAV